MRGGWALLLGVLALGYGFLRSVANDICEEEMRTRLSRLPDALVRLAAWRLPWQVREEFAEEWQAELAFMLSDTAGLPLTRLLRGTHYGLSLLLASRALARELSGDETDAHRDKAAPAAVQETSSLVQAVGYRGPTACAVSGITYRQLDYWTRTGLVQPSYHHADGGDSGRLYSFRDILLLMVIKRLLNTGISLKEIRAAIEHIHRRKTSGLAEITLMSDGASVYECLSADEAFDLLQDGRGKFGIALGRVCREVEGALAGLPAVRMDGPGE